MIAFGCSITIPEVYARYAGPGISLASEPDSVVFAHAAAGPVARSYNLILEKAAAYDDLEAVTFLHQDAEIVDSRFCEKLRRSLRDPAVGVVGCVGAVGAPGIAWWEGSVTWDSFARSYAEFDGVRLPDLSWNGEKLPQRAPMGEVDTLDGFLLALSPWAVRNLRFDESLDLLYGHDFDFCLQVRAAGRKVMTEHLEVVHHHPLELVTDPEAWMEAHMRVAEKWDGRMPHLDQPVNDWKRRARLAEAEAGVARLAGASKLLQAYARADVDDNRLQGVTETTSWRITEPLRRLNAMRNARRTNST
jgi:Glycosyltransferase like family